MKYCSHCKKQTAKSAKFCDECGHPLEASPPIVHGSVPPKSQTPATVPGPPKDIGLRVLAIAAGCVVIWFLGFTNFFDHLFGGPTVQGYYDTQKLFSGDIPSIIKYILYTLPLICFWFGFRSRSV